MNKLQKLFSAVSGYEPNMSSAKDDYYYAMLDESNRERRAHLKAYAEQYTEDLSDEEIAKVDSALIKDLEVASANERFHLFNDL